MQQTLHLTRRDQPALIISLDNQVESAQIRKEPSRHNCVEIREFDPSFDHCHDSMPLLWLWAHLPANVHACMSIGARTRLQTVLYLQLLSQDAKLLCDDCQLRTPYEVYRILHLS